MCNIKITSSDKHDKGSMRIIRMERTRSKQQAVVAPVPWWLVLEHTIAED